MPGFDPSCIDVEHFLETLEVRNLSWATDDELRFSCPFPSHAGLDEKPSCYMNVDTTAFFCHGCKQRGNAIGFTEVILGITPLEAIRLLRDRYQPGAINPDEREMVKEIKNILETKEEQAVQPLIDESVFEKLSVDWEKVDFAIRREQYVPEPLAYMFDRGFDHQTLTDWEFGYDDISNRPVFAVRDEFGQLIGFKGRAWAKNQFPKYFVLGDKAGKPNRYGFPCYHTSQVVYGANRVIGNEECLVICEGELNAISVTMKTGLRAVAINGSHFSDFHAGVIKDKANKAILFLDSDPAGESAVWGWKDTNGIHHDGVVDCLKDFMDVRICPDHEGDAASMNANEIAECLNSSEDWVTIQMNVC
jgi:DNA primase